MVVFEPFDDCVMMLICRWKLCKLSHSTRMFIANYWKQSHTIYFLAPWEILGICFNTVTVHPRLFLWEKIHIFFFIHNICCLKENLRCPLRKLFFISLNEEDSPVLLQLTKISCDWQYMRSQVKELTLGCTWAWWSLYTCCLGLRGWGVVFTSFPTERMTAASCISPQPPSHQVLIWPGRHLS